MKLIYSKLKVIIVPALFVLFLALSWTMESFDWQFAILIKKPVLFLATFCCWSVSAIIGVGLFELCRNLACRLEQSWIKTRDDKNREVRVTLSGLGNEDAKKILNEMSSRGQNLCHGSTGLSITRWKSKKRQNE